MTTILPVTITSPEDLDETWFSLTWSWDSELRAWGDLESSVTITNI